MTALVRAALQRRPRPTRRGLGRGVGFGLVLLAMSLTTIETVAVRRTLNVAVGTLLGLAVLRERLTPLTITGLSAVLGGVLLVSVQFETA